MPQDTVTMSAGRVFLVLAVACLAVYSSLSSYGISSAIRQQSTDKYGVEAQLQRLAPAAAKLPAGVAVGYLSDVAPSSDPGTAAFLASQYALAPHLLVWASPAAPVEWAVGNFSKPADYAAVGAQAGFGVVEDFGLGVLLYRRSRP